MQKSILVLISGNGSNLQAVIDATESGQINGRICAVISNKSTAFGLQRAQKHQIPAISLPHSDYPDRQLYDQALAEVIDRYQPDLIVLAGFMRILTAQFVARYKGKLLNIHPSLLPKYQGLNTHQRALDANDREHGASVHFVTEELDGGPVICQVSILIDEKDTAETLAQRIHKQEHFIYPKAIEWFCQDRLKMESGRVWLDNNELPTTGIRYAE
ncbi:phosphoribosylglycinamide formyltransferase [Gayadomonas joobiniege]|uniref:phosphoribosylglycinamide formyltransferase n=1 Tax=Gayadomonas joobiniege TaxID=1234606 RepID=UPI00036B1246|nr:phosphoribosylglycinamide formyltransferase [Gayadomonas joobiniege]